MTKASSTQGPPPQVIFLIRHAEKPVVTNGATYTGMDVTGRRILTASSPRDGNGRVGWQTYSTPR